MSRASLLFILLIGMPCLALAQANHVVERESNDTAQTANRIALGDSVTGTVSTRSDRDFFALEIPAGTNLTIVRTGGNLRYRLYDRDGVTALHSLGPDNVADHPMKSRFTFPIIVSGTYFIRASAASPEVDLWLMGPYGFVVDGSPLALYSGDPVTAVADLPEEVRAGFRMIAGSHGEVLFCVRQCTLGRCDSGVIFRVDTDGTKSIIDTVQQFSGGFALDAFGDVLVSIGEADSTTSIWRIDLSTGVKEKVVGNLGPYYAYDGITSFAIGVAPNGDFWAGRNSLWHFDPLGRLLGTVTLPRESPGIYAFAISPAGVPYYAYQGRGILRVDAGGAVTEVSDSLGELAFDRDGNLYVGAWPRSDDDSVVWGHVVKLDPSMSAGQQIAHVPYLQGLVFARDAQGELTGRILTVEEGYRQRLVELAGSGTRTPGSGVQLRLHRAEMAALAPATLGSPYRDSLRIPASGPTSWERQSGGLPPGIQLESNGVLAGTPTDTGTFAFSVRGTDGTDVWYGNATLAVQPIAVSEGQIVDALLGVAPLAPPLVEFLDGHGNRNGVLDVGDLRAYLRAQGRITSPTLRARVADPN